MFFFTTKQVLLWQILNAMTDLADIWEPEPQNNSNCKNNGTNFTRGHMGKIPVIRCFVQNFYMVAYVRLGSVPSPSLHCCIGHSFGGRFLFYSATPICFACTVYSLGGPAAGLVLLCWPTRVAKCYPASPSRASLNWDKVFEDAKIWTAVFEICFIIFLDTHTVRMIKLKNQANRPRKQEVVSLDIMQVSHIRTLLDTIREVGQKWPNRS